MKVAQVAPLYESVPPKLYGGTERVVSYLTEELVELGHEVTLFASGDSKTAARLIPGCESSLRLSKGCIDQLAHHYVMLEDVMDHAEEFDIIHFHVDYLHFPLSRISRLPHITTLHGRLNVPDLVPLYRKFRDMPLVSISNGQRKPLCWANWVGNVYHGLPADGLSVGNGSGKYLAFLGRICPEKRVDRAIRVALQTGLPLKIAAKVDRVDREYYECTTETACPAFCPTAFCNWLSFSRSRPTRTTVPCLATSNAVARPMPEVGPVTTYAPRCVGLFMVLVIGTSFPLLSV